MKHLNEKKYHFHRSYSCYKTCSEKLTPKKKHVTYTPWQWFCACKLILASYYIFPCVCIVIIYSILAKLKHSLQFTYTTRTPCCALQLSNIYLYLISFKIQCFDYYFQQQLVYFIKSIILKLLALFNFRFRYYIAI